MLSMFRVHDILFYPVHRRLVEYTNTCITLHPHNTRRSLPILLRLRLGTHLNINPAANIVSSSSLI